MIAGRNVAASVRARFLNLAQKQGTQFSGRELSEVPPSELRLLLEQVVASKGGGGDRNIIHREVVRLMGGNRLASSAREHLARVEEMMARAEFR